MEENLKTQVAVVETVKEEKEEKEKLKLAGTIRPKKNHILFEVNLEDGTIERAEFEDPEFFYWKKGKDSLKRKKVIMKKDCLYISALNEENAIKKLNRALPKKKQFNKE